MLVNKPIVADTVTLCYTHTQTRLTMMECAAFLTVHCTCMLYKMYMQYTVSYIVSSKRPSLVKVQQSFPTALFYSHFPSPAEWMHCWLKKNLNVRFWSECRIVFYLALSMKKWGLYVPGLHKTTLTTGYVTLGKCCVMSCLKHCHQHKNLPKAFSP